jgi:hypothetical protein
MTCTSNRLVSRIEASMRWKRGQRLKLVSETDASGPTREIFSQVRKSLGVPVIPTLYQAYAAFPQFLEAHWRAFRPVLQSRQFFLLGSRLSAECYTRAHNYLNIHSFRHRDVPPQIPALLPLPQVLDYYQYLDPLLLLISAAQMRAFDGPVGRPERSAEPAEHPEFDREPSLLGDEHASLELQRSWNERKRALELTLVPDEHRALSCWPEFYDEYWAALKGLLDSPVYADCQYRLADSALSAAVELPVRVETSITQLLDAGMSDEQVASVVHINQAFMQAMTGLVLDITFARIGCEKDAAETARHLTEQVQEKISSPIRAA